MLEKKTQFKDAFINSILFNFIAKIYLALYKIYKTMSKIKTI